MALGVAIVAAFAPLSAGALPLAALAAVVLGALGTADALRGWGPAPWAELDGAETGTAQTMSLIAHRPAPLRLRLRPAASLARNQKTGGMRLALMASNHTFAAAIRLSQPQPDPGAADIWTGTIEGCERGRFRGLRCGFERRSGWGLWRKRQWRTLDCEFSVYPDLRPGRRQLMASPVYRALAAAAQLPLTGQGREFERLREYQSGDLYSDLSWKATARRAAPVTRLFQWEQQQQIYFVLDHSRLSRPTEGSDPLERMVETTLVAASAAAEVGDEFGFISFAGEVSHWLPAGGGRAQFVALRERLLTVAAGREAPGFETLFGQIKSRLRRRCYLVYFGNLQERGMAAAFLRSARLVSRIHLILAQSILPPSARKLEAKARPGDSAPDAEAAYAALAGSMEWHRIEALRPSLARGGVQFRALPSARFLAAAVEGYLESKRSQRL